MKDKEPMNVTSRLDLYVFRNSYTYEKQKQFVWEITLRDIPAKTHRVKVSGYSKTYSKAYDTGTERMLAWAEELEGRETAVKTIGICDWITMYPHVKGAI